MKVVLKSRADGAGVAIFATIQYKGFERFRVMAFSFDPGLAISAGLFGAILGEP